MRWIDIDLHSGTLASGPAVSLERTAARLEQLADLQRREGLDSPVLLRFMATIGQQLFRAVASSRHDAFAPDCDSCGAKEPPWPGQDAGQSMVGYHLIVDQAWLGLPWTWLHNGLHFLIEKSPICVDAGGSDPANNSDRPWIRRRSDIVFAAEALGPEPLSAVVARLRPEGCAEPEILFLNGSGPAAASVKSRGEVVLVREALENTISGCVLARMQKAGSGIAPGELGRLGIRYQGFHFAGTTATPGSRPLGDSLAASCAEPEADKPHTSGLAVAEPTAEQENAAAADVPGSRSPGDGKTEAVTALMAEIAGASNQPLNRRRGLSGIRLPASTEPVGVWLLEDGPFRPEDLARGDNAPALVFSNSFRSLPDLGGRFLACGVSAFVGTHMAIKPDFAAAFAADFYRSLSKGTGVAAACREAALIARDRHGDHNPAWLAYGVAGSGTLALPFL